MNQCIGLLYFTIINLMIMSNKIYINGRFLTQKLSGVQRHAFELSKHLSEIDKNKIILLVPSRSVIRNEYYYKFNIINAWSLKQSILNNASSISASYFLSNVLSSLSFIG